MLRAAREQRESATADAEVKKATNGMRKTIDWQDVWAVRKLYSTVKCPCLV